MDPTSLKTLEVHTVLEALDWLGDLHGKQKSKLMVALQLSIAIKVYRRFSYIHIARYKS
jgi:hypothetical protein